jgi:hypothetical protein
LTTWRRVAARPCWACCRPTATLASTPRSSEGSVALSLCTTYSSTLYQNR